MDPLKAGVLVVVVMAGTVSSGIVLFETGRGMGLFELPLTPTPSESPKPRPIIDEDEASSRLPLSKALDLDYKHNGNSYTKFRNILRSRLRRRQFEDLDTFAKEVRKSKARFMTGRWRLEEMYAVLDEPAAGSDVSDSDWQTHLKLMEEWIDRFPESITARIAYAESMTGYGWKARTDKWGSEVSDAQFQVFQERLAKAETILIKAGGLPERCPEWYTAMQTVALGQSWDRSRYDDLFADAIAFEPGYPSYYFSQAYFLLPRWYGNEGEWQEVLANVTDTLGTDESHAMFQLAFAHTVLRYYKYDEVAPSIKEYWPRIRQGYHARDKLWQLTFYDVDDYARMAYIAGDRPEARAAFLRLESNWNGELWENDRTLFENAKAWALQ